MAPNCPRPVVQLPAASVGVVGRLRRRLLADHVDGGADGAAAVERRRRALQHLDAVDVGQLGVDAVAFMAHAVEQLVGERREQIEEAAEGVALVDAVVGEGIDAGHVLQRGHEVVGALFLDDVVRARCAPSSACRAPAGWSCRWRPCRAARPARSRPPPGRRLAASRPSLAPPAVTGCEKSAKPGARTTSVCGPVRRRLERERAVGVRSGAARPLAGGGEQRHFCAGHAGALGIDDAAGDRIGLRGRTGRQETELEQRNERHANLPHPRHLTIGWRRRDSTGGESRLLSEVSLKFRSGSLQVSVLVRLGRLRHMPLRPAALLKRSLIFVHRWLGVALSLVFLLWFVSGIVMMYWSFPGVGAGDRLERAPVLVPERIAVSAEQRIRGAGARRALRRRCG